MLLAGTWRPAAAVGLADLVAARLRRASETRTVETRYSADTWLSEYLIPAVSQFGYGGNSYNYGLNTTYNRLAVQEISNTLPGYIAALRGCPPAFAAQMVRALVLSQVRFSFRNRPGHKNPRRLFGTTALEVLEEPWPNATTGELVARMEWHAGLAGNAYVTNYTPGRLRVLRPDWVAIVYGSDQEPDLAAHALDGELLGYMYAPGGLVSTGLGLSAAAGGRIYSILPEQMSHWSPLPDPECAGIGMSWLTPAIRDIQGDAVAAQHKVLYFSNGATPNLVIKGIVGADGKPFATAQQFNDFVDQMELGHKGFANAYKTLYLTGGADASVIGSNMQQVDFKSTIGTGENRIAVLSRVPAAVLGISEGLAGSALNAGNFGQARRGFADTWVYPTLQDLCAALAPLVRVPRDAELWYDVVDMPLLREDAKDLAEIIQSQLLAVESGTRAGFKADAVVRAVQGNDIGALLGQHSGLFSVQMQPAGPDASNPAAQPALDLTRPGTQPALEAAPPAAPATAADVASLRHLVESLLDQQTRALAAPAEARAIEAPRDTHHVVDVQLNHTVHTDPVVVEPRHVVDPRSQYWPADVELDDELRTFVPSQHPRNLAGEHLGKIPIGGRWRKLTGGLRGVADVVRALEVWANGEGPDDPLAGFAAPQLRRTAATMGVDHHGGREELAGRIKDDVRRSVLGRRQALRDLPDYTRGSGIEQPQARDADGKLRDVEIRQGPEGLRVVLLDDKGRQLGAVVAVKDWAALRRWSRQQKLADLTGWVDKYHPVGRAGRDRARKRVAATVATLRRYDTFEQAQGLLYGLEPAELAELYRHLGGGSVELLPTTPAGRVSRHTLIGAILTGWPRFDTVGPTSAGDPMARPAAGSTPEVGDADTSGVYGSAEDWAAAGYDVGYPPESGD